MLQVLLSQLHRLRALKLLTEFLDLGDWATNMSLSVGIHACVLFARVRARVACHSTCVHECGLSCERGSVGG